ncbi:MAG: hypothetical protein ACPGQL_04205 [Thermoplasmatota archaeon]
MLRTLAALALLVLVASPAAALTTYSTVDGAYQITVGHQSSNLDVGDVTNLYLEIRANATDGERVRNVDDTVTATFVAPDGTEATWDLVERTNRPGVYEFDQDYRLLQAGKYTLILRGDIRGSEVEHAYRIEETVGNEEARDFPPAPTNEALAQRVLELERLVADLMGEEPPTTNSADDDTISGDEGGSKKNDRRGSPGLGTLMLVPLAAAALLLRRRS